MRNPGPIEIQQFLTERREALLSMDKIKILAYAQKWGVKNLPQNEETFWIAIHKARTGATDLPIEERRKSKKRLTERGFYGLDDGDI